MKTKDEYVNKIHAKIDEWNMEIDRLRLKAEEAEIESRLELQQRIKELKKQREELKEKTRELSESGSDAWQDIKSGVDLAWEAMNSAVKSATSRFLK